MLHTGMNSTISWAPQSRSPERHFHQFLTSKITERKISNCPRINFIFGVLGIPSGHACNKPRRVSMHRRSHTPHGPLSE
ncbi:hypothetical protein DMX83_08505 [Cutibacterium acnes]|nr:hypothetical protein CGS48_08495 [Cutibacterium acnes]TLG61250.1 hypothetical protein FD536_08510 [Cutibacterium acnes]TNH46750.1 hypothetical protein DMX83_08505 [Cutibacterium acnes]HCW43485.1 hypothetical protein [Cutibacterium acnes]